jgi:hypothetical protein
MSEHFHIVAQIDGKNYDKIFKIERLADNFARKLMKNKSKTMRLEYKELGYAEDGDNYIGIEPCESDCLNGYTTDEQDYELGRSDADGGL